MRVVFHAHAEGTIEHSHHTVIDIDNDVVVAAETR